MHLNNEFVKKMYFVRLTVLTNYPFYGYILDEFGIIYTEEEKITDKLLAYDYKIYINYNYALSSSIVVLAYKIYKELKRYISNIYCSPIGVTTNTNPRNSFLDEKKNKVFENDKNGYENDNEEKNNDKYIMSEILNDRSNKISYFKVPKNLRQLIKPIEYKEIDWRDILKDYLTYDLEDYDFCPPDRRFQGDFLLPAFNEINENIKDIIFMIDVSDSMKIETIQKVFNEVRNAFDSFRGRIKAFVGWFDYEVKNMIEIDEWEDKILENIVGGGSTSFENMFDYVENFNFCNAIRTMIVLTDGYSTFPKNYSKYEFDTIWIMTTDVKPLFGKCVKYE